MSALPPLRPDLRVEPDPDGAGALLLDPLAGRWHRVGAAALAMLKEWDGGTRGAVLARSGAQETELDALLQRLDASGLVLNHERRPPPEHRGPLHRIMHGYLFVRIPLVDPTLALDRLVPSLRPVLCRGTVWTLLLMAVIGLALAARHAAEIERQLTGLVGLDGALWLAMSFVVAKLVHEAGHAICARAMGAHVPTLGIAFMVLWPVLYTDTSDAWRLPARKRLVIDAAGVLAEGTLAIVALWAWLILPDGGARDAALMLATVGLIGSVAVNLNPFMRFDGYHLLADLWRMPNLQPRAFAMGRWRMREALFALGEPPPEPLPPVRRRLIVLYAWTTWLYRLALFIGIALLVYHMAFKALGIILFAVEIGWFVLRPLRDEAREWWSRRRRIARGRRLAWIGGAGGTALVLFVPWSGTVVAPAVLAPVSLALHAPEPGILVFPPDDGATLALGDKVLGLASPALEGVRRERRAAIEVEAARQHRAAVDRSTMVEWRVSYDRVVAAETALASVTERLDALHRPAPRSGTVVDVPPDLRAGQWVARERSLGRLLTGTARVDAYVPEAAWERVHVAEEAVFVPYRLDRASVPLASPRIGEVGRRLAHPILAARNGGSLALVPDAEGDRLRGAHVRLAFDSPAVPERAVVGTVRLRARRTSLASRIARRLAAVAIREAEL